MAKPRPAAADAARAGGRDIAARLAAIGLRSDWDFVLHLPLRYEDETVVVPIDQLREGLEAQVEAVVTAAADVCSAAAASCG